MYRSLTQKIRLAKIVALKNNLSIYIEYPPWKRIDIAISRSRNKSATEMVMYTLFLSLQNRKYQVSKKKFRLLKGCGIRSMSLIYKTEMFIYQSKVSLDEKILFGSIPHLTDPEIRKRLVKGMFGNKNSHSILVHHLTSIEIGIQHRKLAM